MDTAADYTGKIPRLQLFVMFHAATMRWERRREKMYKKQCFISLDKSHTLFYILAFLHEHKDIETRMFVSIILRYLKFPIIMLIYNKPFFERWEEILHPSLSCSSYSAICSSDSQGTDMQMLLGKVTCCRV